jgi:hypothetical protein
MAKTKDNTAVEEKKYTVKFKEEGRRARSQSFDLLVDAREFGMEKYREGSFKSLTNTKKVVLPLGGKRRMEQPVSVNF